MRFERNVTLVGANAKRGYSEIFITQKDQSSKFNLKPAVMLRQAQHDSAYNIQY